MSIIAYFIEWNNVFFLYIKYENLSIFIIINQYATLPPLHQNLWLDHYID